ncbi:hypothetical protein ROTAS13_04597 [Roseomonas sp. TAS13]|uniref:DUF2442 domain-containing protein n=1 Tax=Roseomonas TaxID=125216 RepID=UPI00095E6553|nr:DUF2442 domain-containing protein [Roseomonas sp. TAS13]GAV36908.1 hypothetical protein ROTAS13_04597 [Roseomonas sp. TAS13]
MGDLTDTQIDATLARGQEARQREPRAATARYDRQARRVIVELTNGCTFAFPPGLAQGLEGASDDQLAQVEVLGSGSGLHWEALDADLSIPGLLAGLFGTRAHMARQAGRATSPAKAAAARANGSKGGRPRRAAGT